MIVQVTKPGRIFERFGFDLPKSPKISTKKAMPTTQCKEYIFAIEVFDCIYVKTGEGPTGYTPIAQLE